MSLPALAAAVALRGAAPPAADWSGCDEILRHILPPDFPIRDFPVTDFGAKGDGRTDCHAAFVRAIDACWREVGAGRVTVPPGVYFCDGPIRLKTGVDLYISEGATIRFGADPAHYLPLVPSRYEGTLDYSQSPRIYADHASHIAVTGRGTIDGNGRATLELMRSEGSADPAELRRMGATGVPVERRTFGPGRWLRPSLIEFCDCADVLVQGITATDSAFWVIHPFLCRNVTVRGVTVDSLNPNNDGCDPDSCADVLIEDCRFHTGDDAIAIKSGRDQDGWRVGRPSENIVVRDCTMDAKWGGVCIGSEMSGDVRNVWIEDCRMPSVSSALYFKANLDRGGLVETVRARRIEIGEARAAAVRFETGYHGYGGGGHPPTFRDFVIEDVHCRRADVYGIYVQGPEIWPVQDITIRRTVIDSAPGRLWLRGDEGVRLEAVKVDGAELPENPLQTPAGEAKLKIDS